RTQRNAEELTANDTKSQELGLVSQFWQFRRLRQFWQFFVSLCLPGRCCLSYHARLRAIPRDLSRLPRRSRGALPWITGDLHPSASSAYSVFQRCWGWFLNFGNSGNYGISSRLHASRCNLPVLCGEILITKIS